MPDPAWSTIFLVVIVAINFLGVRIYGELEYWFALIKILIVLVFIIIGKSFLSYKKCNYLYSFYFFLGILVTAGAVGGHTIGFE